MLKKFLFFLAFICFLPLYSQYSNDKSRSEILKTFTPQLSSDDDYWDNGFAGPVTQNPEVRAVAVDGRTIYTIENRKIIMFDTLSSSWKFIGDCYGTINTMVAKNGRLYIGGLFQRVNNVKANNFAVWNGIKWDSLGNSPKASVNAICIDDDNNIYIGGDFKQIGSKDILFAAINRNKEWSMLGEGLDAPVRSMIFKENKLYCSGDFTSTGNLTLNKVAVWDLSFNSWLAMGNGISEINTDLVNTIAFSGSDLYAGGSFYFNGQDTLTNLAKWDGTKWSVGFKNVNGYINSLCLFNGKLIAGGDFKTINGTNYNYIAVLNGKDWTVLDTGLSGGEYPLILKLQDDGSGNLYVCGTFRTAGGKLCNGIVKWNGKNWEDIFNQSRMGINSIVSDMVVSGANYLFAGGGFLECGEVLSPGIAYFDGTKWYACNQGLTPSADVVYSMASSGDNIYFTGWFYYADGIPLNNVAIWNEKFKYFNTVGKGIDGGDGVLGPIALYKKDIFVGGDFIVSGGLTYNRLAHWDGKTWKQMGSNGVFGVRNFKDTNNSTVISMAVDNESNLYIGGWFDHVADIEAKNLAVYNIETDEWSAFGKGLEGFEYVRKIAVYGDTIIFGGNFTKIDTFPAKNIALFNKKTKLWSSFGSGMNAGVYDIIKWFDDIYIGGGFDTAGGVKCCGIAKFNSKLQKFEPLGSGVGSGYGGNGSVTSIKVYNNALYVAGNFTSAGGKIASNFSRWRNIPVAVNEEETKNDDVITVYPMPVDNKINIISNDIYFKSIKIISLSGYEVQVIKLAENQNNITFETGLLSSGTYILSIFDGSNYYNRLITVYR